MCANVRRTLQVSIFINFNKYKLCNAFEWDTARNMPRVTCISVYTRAPRKHCITTISVSSQIFGRARESSETVQNLFENWVFSIFENVRKCLEVFGIFVSTLETVDNLREVFGNHRKICVRDRNCSETFERVSELVLRRTQRDTGTNVARKYSKSGTLTVALYSLRTAENATDFRWD